MLRSTIVFILSIGFTAQLLAQDSISGKVFDGHTEKVLAKAKVRMGNRNVRTDAYGTFTLPFKRDKNLEVSAGGFHDYERSPEDISDLNEVSVYLTPTPQISGLRVSAEAVGVYEPDFEYLFDFEFIDDRLIVGSYLNREIGNSEKGSSLTNCALTLFDNGEMVHRTLIADYPSKLRRSAFNELYVHGLGYALAINVEEGKLKTDTIGYKMYLADVVPWTVAMPNSAFRARIVREIPQVVHYVAEKGYDRLRVVRIVRNKPYFAKTFRDFTMLDREQKDYAKELSAAQGFPPELYAGYIRAHAARDLRRAHPDINRASRDIRTPYAPVYKQGKDVLIMDALNEMIYRHGQAGDALDSVYFQVDLPGEELVRIEQDRVDQKLYAIHHRKGVHYVREIKTETGALGRPMKIAFPFPEKIKIYNGNVFYIRHNVAEKFKHLYKESIRFP